MSTSSNTRPFNLLFGLQNVESFNVKVELKDALLCQSSRCNQRLINCIQLVYLQLDRSILVDIQPALTFLLSPKSGLF